MQQARCRNEYIWTTSSMPLAWGSKFQQNGSLPGSCVGKAENTLIGAACSTTSRVQSSISDDKLQSTPCKILKRTLITGIHDTTCHGGWKFETPILGLKRATLTASTVFACASRALRRRRAGRRVQRRPHWWQKHGPSHHPLLRVQPQQ